MPGDIDPFQPWRPAGAEPAPREEPAWSAVPPSTPQPGGASNAQVTFATLAAALGLALVFGLAVSGQSQITRLGAAAAALLAGAWVALFARRWRWYVRAAGAAVGVGLAVASWYLMPTTAGLSLREAERRLAELSDIPAGDFEAFQASRPIAGQVGFAFPRWERELDRAKTDWGRRTLAKEVEAADGAADPRAALTRLREVQSKLEAIFYQPLPSPTLLEARERALRAILDRERQEAQRLAKQGKYGQARDLAVKVNAELHDEARELDPRREVVLNVLRDWERQVKGDVLRRQGTAAVAALQRLHDGKKYAEVAKEGPALRGELLPEAEELNMAQDVLPQLDAVREKALRARLAQVEGEFAALAAKAKYPDVATTATGAGEAMAPEAKLLGLADTVKAALLKHRKAALLARVKTARHNLQGLYDKKDYTAVPKRYDDLLAELTVEADEVGERLAMKEQLGAVREKALLARVDGGKKELEDLFTKKEHVKVATRGAALRRELEAEAEQVGALGRLGKALDEVRRKALQARLDDAAKELTGLIVKKSLADVATRGAALDAVLRPEAKAVELEKKLDDAVLAARRKALRARLDVARAESRELLKKDRYEAMGELGEKTHKALAAEAEVVGAAGDVKKFRDGCRVFADLAKKAKVKEKK